MKSAVFVLLLTCVAAAGADNEKEFKSLLNGRDLTGWLVHGWKSKPSWRVVDGSLTNEWSPKEKGTNLMTSHTFWNFTIRLEFKVPEGSNSGIYLRGRHEIQLTGDYSAKKLGPVTNGAIFNFAAPKVYASKPSGEWQNLEATIVGHEISATLNGQVIHDRVFCDKVTGHGVFDNKVTSPGPILLQGTHGAVKFRNIRIKELPR